MIAWHVVRIEGTRDTATEAWTAKKGRWGLWMVASMVWPEMTWISRSHFFAFFLMRFCGWATTLVVSNSGQGHLLEIVSATGTTFFGGASFFLVTTIEITSSRLMAWPPGKAKLESGRKLKRRTKRTKIKKCIPWAVSLDFWEKGLLRPIPKEHPWGFFGRNTEEILNVCIPPITEGASTMGF